MTAKHGNDGNDDPRIGLIEEGMLSPLLEEWRLIYLDNQPEWFALAREVNRCAMGLYQQHLDAGDGGPANAQAPTAEADHRFIPPLAFHRPGPALRLPDRSPRSEMRLAGRRRCDGTRVLMGAL